MRTLILLLLINQAFAASPKYRDKELKKKDAPAYLIAAIPSKGDVDDVEFFEKNYDDGKKTFELKYELDDQEVSLTFSESGTLLEKEQDIKLSSLPTETQAKINSYFNEKYPGFKFHEAELRTDKDKTELIDIEISHKSFSGFLEVSFTKSGDYVSEKREHAPDIETLN